MIDPYCIALRKRGQRWVKITYFRDFDLLHTEQARFPVDLIGTIIRATARRYPQAEDFVLQFTDPRGTDLRIDFSPSMRAGLLATTRWRGLMTAQEDGAYVHYLPNAMKTWSRRPSSLAMRWICWSAGQTDVDDGA